MGVLKQHACASQASVAHQELIDPLQNGYTKDDDGIPKPHAADELPVSTRDAVKNQSPKVKTF